MIIVIFYSSDNNDTVWHSENDGDGKITMEMMGIYRKPWFFYH